MHVDICVCNAPFCGSSDLCQQGQKPKRLNAVTTSVSDFLNAFSCSPSAAELHAVDIRYQREVETSRLGGGGVKRQPAHGAEVKAAASSS